MERLKSMSSCIEVLLLLLTTSTSHAQESAASPQSGGTVEDWMTRVEEARARGEKEFNSQPPIVRINFFINDDEVPLNDGFSFRLLVDSAAIQPTSIDGPRFLFPS